ncbi:hypothetical protein FIH18_23730 [Salmonella enterica subsp. enterica]|nr:hypothetical protein [Salmonella enterica subsp. enterica serovar Saintpaul]EBG0558262.1 hypothetical protein [Salmonella enterica subsp. enterica serovar Saintpaul]
MTRDDIANELKSIVDDFNNGIIGKQQSINKNISNIENIKQAGVTYKVVFDILNSLLTEKIKYSHFRDLLFKAKKHASKYQTSTKSNACLTDKNEVINKEPNFTVNKNSGRDFFSSKITE